ncbi:LuxR C-terminal-related transcriptional regulator [Microbacterium sp. B2969]|uniref:LuxR C-terminal-related transcriptional regulator n=1 Tax=Microbacterium alkaliflavum TaxID=3248839 RepID=A0ABW7QFR7_9MICO
MNADAQIPSPAERRLQAERSRTIVEETDRHAVALESILAILRSARLDDRAARTLAIDTAASALVDLRTATDEQRTALIEPVVGAFARLRSDLKPLVRFGDLDVQFVEPPANGRALPGDVAHAARAIVRHSVLALVDAGDAHRVRIQWDCDGLNLLIAIRDDGRGELAAHDDSLRPIAERVTALDGELKVDSTPGWGSAVEIVLPLDPPSEPETLFADLELSPREQEVLSLLATGLRNRDIADRLAISENTAKFHVSNLLRKSGSRSRAALIATVRQTTG